MLKECLMNADMLPSYLWLPVFDWPPSPLAAAMLFSPMTAHHRL
jgi:hypothetical protein